MFPTARTLHSTFCHYPQNSLQPLARRQLPLWKVATSNATITTGQGPLTRDTNLASLEALLFAADEPLPLRRLTSLIRAPGGDEVKRQLKRLQGLYDQERSAFQIVEIAGGYQLRTREAFLPWLLKLRPAAEVSLSSAARETLTMIAYQQPITRADLESLRGVSCGDLLRSLLEKGLIRIVGRDNSLGRPVLYGTTKQFLETFGLKSLQELPAMKD